MTARERLAALRSAIIGTIVLRALLAGAAVVCVGLTLGRAFGLPSALSLGAWAIGAAAALLMATPARAARSAERVALWVEERQPSLRYALVTVAGAAGHPEVEVAALAIPWWRDAHRALGRALVLPALSFATALALLHWSPDVMARGAATLTMAGDVVQRRDDPAMDVLARVRLVVTAPAYSGRAAILIDDPTNVEALVGSIVTVSGRGDASGVQARVDSMPRGVAARAGGWSLSVAMPPRAALLRLRSSLGRQRLIVLAPVVDASPVVILLQPARDTVVRTATGTLDLRAAIRDDIGLGDARFELIVSSGTDENFTFRSTTLGRRQFAGGAEAVLSARLSLDSLALKAGDVVQVRAVARDRNDVTGPGLGSSETRAIRVARAGEYDSVSVDPAAAPEPDAQVLSQRMLITLAEALVKRRNLVSRPTMIEESRRLAADQTRLRKRVGDIVFQRLGNEPLSEEGSDRAPIGKLSPDELLKLADEATNANPGTPMDVEGDETPILAVNKPLLEAFNAMWDAGRSLEQGEPARALPFMRRALAAIERARQAERIYLRGRPSAVVVDVARARLAGKDKGASSERAVVLPSHPMLRRRAEGFLRATALLDTDPGAAADSLLVMRVEALENAPVLAAALDDAARTVRRGDRATVALAWARLRRVVAGVPTRQDALPVWSGGAGARR